MTEESQARPPVPQPRYHVGDRAWVVTSTGWVLDTKHEDAPARIIEIEVEDVYILWAYEGDDKWGWSVMYRPRLGDDRWNEKDAFDTLEDAVIAAEQRTAAIVAEHVEKLQARLSREFTIIRMPPKDDDGEG